MKTQITRAPSRRRRRRQRRWPLFLLLAAALVIAVGFSHLGSGQMRHLKSVSLPDWVDVQIIPVNGAARRGEPMKKVTDIAIHYVGNPGTTAAQNHSFFTNLAQTGETYASSHFLVGLDGEVIQCIPITEIAYANAPRNDDTIAIEVCHPDETVKFNDATYESVVNLTAALCKELKLTSKDVVRHYDINGKVCPKYFVDHEDAWEQLKKDVDAAMKGSK
mgnify:CR=1 FL=1